MIVEFLKLIFRCNLNINPLFKDAIEKCLTFKIKERIDINSLLAHPMFGNRPENTDILREKRREAKSQSKISFTKWQKVKWYENLGRKKPEFNFLPKKASKKVKSMSIFNSSNSTFWKL